MYQSIRDIRDHPLRGRQTEVGMIKPAIFQKHGASINRSIQHAINLVRRSTAINTLATAVRVSTVNSHLQSNEHWKVEYEHPFSRASAAQQLKACPCLSYPNSVRPSVCLSHAGIVSKRLNVLSWFFHHTIAHSFLFLPLTHVLLAVAILLVHLLIRIRQLKIQKHNKKQYIKTIYKSKKLKHTHTIYH